jgi:hypothetical protein
VGAAFGIKTVLPECIEAENRSRKNIFLVPEKETTEWLQGMIPGLSFPFYFLPFSQF